MRTDTLIVGQGLAGSWLAVELQERGHDVVVIDKGAGAASAVAGGVINPVSGRRVVTTWMADELLPFCKARYESLGNSLIREMPIIVFPGAPDLQQAFRKRVTERNHFIHEVEAGAYRDSFNFPFGVFGIDPAMLVDVPLFLDTVRQRLLSKGRLISSECAFSKLVVDRSVQYGDVTADRIVFCDGAAATNNPFWQNLPFALNKGEALIVDSPHLDRNSMYKFGALTLVPWQDQWWAGSSYGRSFADASPTPAFYSTTTRALRAMLKIPFEVTDHVAGIRPATVERRPFAGFHPSHPRVGILNGFGTKGCSLAPWFAKQLADNIVSGIPVSPEANVSRFARVLSR